MPESAFLSDELHERWQLFLQRWELARHYKLYNARMGPSPPNPILDQMLPSLMHVKLVSLLDEALQLFIENSKITMPRKYRKDLNGRLCYLNDEGRLTCATELHIIRQRRNDIAHASDIECNWSTLEEDIDKVEQELRHLQLTGMRPAYKFFAERSRSKAQGATDPDVAFQIACKCGVRWPNGNSAIEIAWFENILKRNAGN